jgi:hypothetical protein
MRSLIWGPAVAALDALIAMLEPTGLRITRLRRWRGDCDVARLLAVADAKLRRAGVRGARS